METSVFRRLWNALKPPPAVQPRWRPTPRQKRILTATLSVLGVAGLAGGLWAYYAGAPARAQIQFEQGMGQVGAGNYRAALASLNRSIATWPHNAQAYYNRGMAHRLLGESDAAMVDFSRAIAEKANFAEAYTERAAIAQERGDAQSAMQDFSHALELAPSANGYFQRGQAYESLGQLQKALEDYDRSIHERPDAPYIYRARANVRRRLGDMAGYTADRDQSVKLETSDFPLAWVDSRLADDAVAQIATAPVQLEASKPLTPSKTDQGKEAAKAAPRNSRGAPAPSPREAPPSH